MTAPTIVPPNEDLLGAELGREGDDFDLDIRVTVQPDASRPEAGFSNWQTCKGTCVTSCGCGYTQAQCYSTPTPC
jgi:hypothetical protein